MQTTNHPHREKLITVLLIIIVACLLGIHIVLTDHYTGDVALYSATGSGIFGVVLGTYTMLRVAYRKE